MPVRKRKPIEANDGSYGGLVLAAFDNLPRLTNTRGETTMNDLETLAWAKERALEYVDARHAFGVDSAGSLAITSMISDLGKHPGLAELRMHAVMTSPFNRPEDEIRAWIRDLGRDLVTGKSETHPFGGVTKR